MPVLPIDVTDVILAMLLGLAVLTPVVGLTARFALKPVVEALARMREAQGASQAVAMLERRMALVEQEMQALSGIREDLRRLVEEQEFQRELAAPHPVNGRLGGS
ncbi:MAG: hypothetical protein M3418_10005 [Gemmatimonadota bacterium]|nr:hypothetical protein [Gemmatimonadota bacterium]